MRQYRRQRVLTARDCAVHALFGQQYGAQHAFFHTQVEQGLTHIFTIVERRKMVKRSDMMRRIIAMVWGLVRHSRAL